MVFSALAVLDYYDVVFFSIAILLVFLLLIATCCFGYWLTHQRDSVSPYTGKPLRKTSDLSYFYMEMLLRYFYELNDYDNVLIDLSKAAFCRETGRVFPNALTWYDRINVNWNFLQKRLPGNYVSWGSLTDFQKEVIQDAHHVMEGFQTEFSSPTPSPRLIEKKYAYAKPGPLYVDLETKILMGWKSVPNTDLEVLIVQRPRGIFEPQIRNIDKES